MLRLATPALIGSKLALTTLVLPAKLSGEEIVPTLVSELVNGTSTVKPPRTAWCAAKLLLSGFNLAVRKPTLRLAENEVVLKLLEVK